MITDGGLATTLADAGHDVATPLWSGQVVVDAPRAVLAVHQAFASAGADVLTTASYQLTVDGLVRAGVGPSQAWRTIAATVALARGGAEDAGREVMVAGSCGTWAAVHGHEYRPMDPAVSIDRLAAFHLERARLLREAGADILLFETLPGVREVCAAVQVADELRHPSWITVTTSDGAHTTDGEDLALVARAVEESQVGAVGLNCVDPGAVMTGLARLRSGSQLPLIARPNAGARYRDGAWFDPDVRAVDSGAPIRWRDSGARVIGGCCGTTPDDIATLARHLGSR